MSQSRFEPIVPLRSKVRRAPPPTPADKPTRIRNPQAKTKNQGFLPSDVDKPWVLRAFCGFLDYRSNPIEPGLLTLLMTVECHCRQEDHCLVSVPLLALRTGRSESQLACDLAELMKLGWIYCVDFDPWLGIVLLDRADHTYTYANAPEKLARALYRLADLARIAS